MALDYVKRLNRLKDLMDQAGSNYFERIRIADELLGDKNWLATVYGGEDYKAAEALERDYFHDLSGSMTIFQLLEIYRKFSSEKEWQKYGYNLRVMFTHCKSKVETRQVTRVKLSEYEAVQQEATEAKYKLKTVERELKNKTSTIQELEDRIEELETENANLTGRIEELERILDGKFARV